MACQPRGSTYLFLQTCDTASLSAPPRNIFATTVCVVLHTRKACERYLEMDDTPNISTDADAHVSSLNGEDNVTPMGHEPSSPPHQGANGQGTFLWPEDAADLPSQPINPVQAAMESAQFAPESLIDDTVQNATGFGFRVRSSSNDGSFVLNQQSLAYLIGPLPVFRGNKRSSMKTSNRIMRILEENPDVDINELVDGEGIIHVACRHNRLELLNFILERPNFNVNLRTHEGLAGLHIVCHEDNDALVDALLQSPHIDVNIRDGSSSRTPLHITAMKGNLASMKRLLDTPEIDVQTRDADGYLPVHYAAEHPIPPTISWFSNVGEDGVSELMLQISGNGAVNVRTIQDRGPLHLAAQAGHIAALQGFLAQPDLDINMADAQGDTALHLAADIDVAGLLLKSGIDSNVQNADGNTALHCALEQRRAEMVHLLLEHTRQDPRITNEKGEQLMHIAAAKWDIETFKQLAPATPHTHIDAQTKNGETVMHIAAQAGAAHIVEYLLDFPNIDVNVQGGQSQTPLHLACEEGHIDIVTMLLNHPFVYVNPRDEMRQTPLYLACEKGHLGVVRALLACEQIDVEAGDERGWTPLHVACESAAGEPIVSELLLQATIDIDKQIPSDGATALHIAAFMGHFKTVRNLLEHGADPRITCTRWIGPDGGVGQDAAGVAGKIEIVDLIRHYRGREISLAPSPLTYSQEVLLGGTTSMRGIYIVWEWPPAEFSRDETGGWSRRKRIFADISSVFRIYAILKLQTGAPTRVNFSLDTVEQWQLRHASYRQKGFSLPLPVSVSGKERPTKWIHFSAQNVSNIEIFPCDLRHFTDRDSADR